MIINSEDICGLTYNTKSPFEPWQFPPNLTIHLYVHYIYTLVSFPHSYSPSPIPNLWSMLLFYSRPPVYKPASFILVPQSEITSKVLSHKTYHIKY